MKHFMQPRNPILREIHSPSETASSPNPKQRLASSSRKQKWSKENNPPSDPIAMLDPPLLAGKPSPATAAAKIRSPLPPRPPSSKALKRKFSTDAVPEHGSSDTGVKVVVRMRPPTKDEEEEELVVQKISGDSLSINGHTFTFDSVADNGSTQVDIFQLVGAPLVENCLSGFNSSVFAYGQTGSGKTYTMWGPANALLEENTSDQRGLTPRVFEHLFSRIDEEQNKNADKQVIYQCRCSFLEIYNEQITDLLDPSQGNLQIREDVKSGVYVENLTEECVSSMKDVTNLLLKGLSNRRTGATSINAESSRSHSVFTCVVESRSKSPADGLSCCKTSRINLVDLAGSERQKLTGAAGERLKEAGNINRSLSQLGNLINILAEVSQTGKQRHIPYRDSRLTFLLQESLGGNAKLAMVCAISPAQSCKSETLSTLRFAQHAKSIKNKAVVNEEMQDDVNSLRAVIRQLRDELLRMKTKDNQADPSGGYSTGWNARRSLNLLKFSLNRPMILPNIDDDSDEEMEIVEEADQIGGKTRNESDIAINVNNHSNISGSAAHECLQLSRDTDVIMEVDISEQADKCEISAVGKVPSTNSSDDRITDIVIYQNVTGEKAHEKVFHSLDKKVDGNNFKKPSLKRPASFSNLLGEESPRKTVGSSSRDVLHSETPGQPSAHVEEAATSNTPPNSSVDQLASTNQSPLEVSPILRSPTLSVSPRVNDSMKSLSTAGMLTALKDDVHGARKSGPEAIHLSFAKTPGSSRFNTQSFQASRSCFPPTESLAASLQRGLDIIDGHRQSSVLRRSSFRFPCKQVDLKSISAISKVDVGVQTLPEENELEEEDSQVFLCSRCKSGNLQEDLADAHDNSSLQIVPVSVVKSVDKTKKIVPKAVEKVLAGAIRREMALEEFCAKQTAEIMQLNRLVQQYKHERECNSIIGHTREDKIVRLENLMDGILPTEEFMEDELLSLTNEHKLLKEKYENHPEVLRTKIEMKRVQDELEQYRNFFDMGERDVLLEEINDLRSQLQYYLDSSSMPTRKQSPVQQLTYSCDSGASKPLCTIRESTEDNTQQNRESNEDDAQQKLEQERIQWTEAESKWISLAEDLKIELESSRSVAEKLKHELHLEKKCSEELKEAMQMAMEGHARMLEQYADLEEKHMQMLARQRQILDGIDDVKKAAAKAGVRGAESRFINALAAEVSSLKVEREKERRYFRDEIKGLQVQLRDTAEAVQAAGELLVRLKEAEETIAAAEMRAALAEEEAEKAYKMVNKLKRKHDKGMSHNEAHLPKKVSRPLYDDGSDQLKYDGGVSYVNPEDTPRPVYDDSDVVKYDAGESCNTGDHLWLEEFEPSYNTEEGEVTKLAEPSWFTGYDRCNI